MYTSRRIASLSAGLTLMIYWAGRLHASETQQLSYNIANAVVADWVWPPHPSVVCMKLLGAAVSQ